MLGTGKNFVSYTLGRVEPLVYNFDDSYYAIGASGGNAGYRKPYKLGKTGPAPPLFFLPSTTTPSVKQPKLLFRCSKKDYRCLTV